MQENRKHTGCNSFAWVVWFGKFTWIIEIAEHAHLLTVCLLDLRYSLDASALIIQDAKRLHTLSSVRADVENIIKVRFDRHLTTN